LLPPNNSRPLNPERSKKSGNCSFLFDPKTLEGSLVDDRGLCREVFWRGARELRGTTETLTEAGLSVEVAEIDAPPDGGRVLMAT